MTDTPLYIILVEDNPTHAEAIRRSFHRANPDTLVRVADTLRAFRELTVVRTPDIAIMDMNLPDGKVEDALALISECDKFPVVAMTSFGTDVLAARIIKAGAVDYYVKSHAVFSEMPNNANRALREWKLLREKMKADASIRESEHLYHSLFDNMLNGFAFCKMLFEEGQQIDFMYLIVNSAFETLTGLKDVANKKVSEVIPGIQQSNPEIFEIYGRVALTGNPEKFETYVTSLKMWFSISVYSPKKEFFVAVFDVITERKRSEEALRRSEERFHILFDNSPDSVIIVSLDGIIEEVNFATQTMTGYAREELVGKPFTDLKPISAEELPQIMAHFKSMLEGNVLPFYEMELTRKSGEKRFVETLNSLLKKDDVVMAMQVICRDVTDRRRVEKELRHSEDQLRQSQKMEAVGRLAGGIAHDFNNMLTVINNYAEFAIEKLHAGDPLKADIEEILKAGERSADLTQQLLAFSRKQPLAPEVLDINLIIADIEPMFHRLIGEDIDLVLNLSERPGRVKADPGQIEQVIMNLVVNSRDAMPGGGKLTIKTANVEIVDEHANHSESLAPGQYVMLSITDTGCGMDEKTEEHIFEPFFTTKETGKGTGLGLSTVYGIVKQSGGNILVFSEPGKGSTFEIYLPREFSEAAAPSREKKSAGQKSGTETILVVEDEPGVLNLMKRVLESTGYIVHTAANGGEALLACERMGDSIHLIITDIVMPDMNGRELIERLSKICPRMKKLYMSGYTEDDIVHHGILDEGIHFLPKPFSLPALKSKVREVLDN